MSLWVESLERRALFTVVTVPTNVLLATDALTVDVKNLKADVASAAKTMAADLKVISADVKALGKSPTNTPLLRQVKSAEAKAIASLSAATSRYAAAAKPAFNRMEVAASLFAALPSNGTSKRLAAAQAALTAIQAKQFNALVTVVTNGGVAYANALAVLASANPAAVKLNADAQAAINDQAALSTAEDAIITKIQTEVPTLLNAV